LARHCCCRCHRHRHRHRRRRQLLQGVQGVLLLLLELLLVLLQPCLSWQLPSSASWLEGRSQQSPLRQTWGKGSVLMTPIE